MLLLKTNEQYFQGQFNELLRRGNMDMENVSKIVLTIIAEIKAEGNGALKNHIEKTTRRVPRFRFKKEGVRL